MLALVEKCIMKKFLFLSAVFITTVLFAQENIPDMSATRLELLQKAKSQKTAAIILGVSGSTVCLIGMVLELGQLDFRPGVNKEYKSFPSVMMYTGMAAIVGSIPLSLAARRNWKKANATNVFIRMENSMTIQRKDLCLKRYPAFGVKFIL